GLMTIEAMQAFGWKSGGIALRLRNHPAQVQTLKRFRQAVQEIPLFNLRILTIDPGWLDRAAEVSQQTGLLHNDALTIAVMRFHGLTHLASADPDFARVPGLARYGPLYPHDAPHIRSARALPGRCGLRLAAEPHRPLFSGRH